MSEETQPAKKAARKSVRKKSASKRAPRKSAKSESENGDEQLPLEESSNATNTHSSPQSEEKGETAPDQKGREPKSGVRDARRETAGDPIPAEVIEKLVPDENDEGPPKEKPQQNNRNESKEGSDQSQRDQGKQDQNDRRSRGRGRGGRDRDRDRERPEKREPKQRVSVDTKDLAKKAWKIFESEVTEEGLALLDDNGLRDYARSSFNAARLFLEEKGRVVGHKKQPKIDKEED